MKKLEKKPNLLTKKEIDKELIFIQKLIKERKRIIKKIDKVLEEEIKRENKILENLLDWKINHLNNDELEKNTVRIKNKNDSTWLVSSKKINWNYERFIEPFFPQIPAEQWDMFNKTVRMDWLKNLMKEKGAKAGDIMVINDFEIVI